MARWGRSPARRRFGRLLRVSFPACLAGTSPWKAGLDQAAIRARGTVTCSSFGLREPQSIRRRRGGSPGRAVFSLCPYPGCAFPEVPQGSLVNSLQQFVVCCARAVTVTRSTSRPLRSPAIRPALSWRCGAARCPGFSWDQWCAALLGARLARPTRRPPWRCIAGTLGRALPSRACATSPRGASSPLPRSPSSCFRSWQ